MSSLREWDAMGISFLRPIVSDIAGIIGERATTLLGLALCAWLVWWSIGKSPLRKYRVAGLVVAAAVYAAGRSSHG